MNKLYNTSITKDSPIMGHLGYPAITQEQSNEVLSYLFEQLLLFDEIVISTDKDNYALFFLVKTLGIRTVERLIKAQYLKFEISKSLIFLFEGNKNSTLEENEKELLGRPPLISGGLIKADLDPEENVDRALSHFNLQRGYKRILIRDIAKSYVNLEENELATDSVKIIIDAYKSNLLESIGLPFEKDETMLNLQERKKLLSLSGKILGAVNMLKNNYKSMNSYDELEILKKGYNNIGKAFKVTDNTSELLKIENVPDLKQLFLMKKYNIDDIFRLRHLKNAKIFRQWINDFNQELDLRELTSEYISEATQSKTFLETSKGKFLKEISIFSAASSIGALIAGPGGLVAGFLLGYLANTAVENINKGKNPKIYIDKIKNDIQ